MTDVICKVEGCGECVYCTAGPYAYLCGPCKGRVLALMDRLNEPRTDTEVWVRSEWMVAQAVAKLTVYGEVECLGPDPDGELLFRFVQRATPAEASAAIEPTPVQQAQSSSPVTDSQGIA